MSSAVGARLLKNIIVESSRKVFLHFLLLLSSSQTKGQPRPFAACLRTAQIHSGAFLVPVFVHPRSSSGGGEASSVSGI